MKKISPDDLNRMLKEHGIWLRSDGQKGTKADLSGTDLSEAALSETRLMLANLYRARLCGASMVLIDLSQANLSRADLSDADLSGADLLLSNFFHADLSGADLSVADLSGANLSHARLPGASLPQADLSRACLTGADLSGADLSGANFANADLSHANLSQSHMRKASFFGANLSGANLLQASFHGADFTEANLGGVMIDSLTMAQLPADTEKKYKQTFQIIETEKTDRFAIIREMRLPAPYYQAGLAILDFFGMFLAQEGPGELKIRTEFRNYTVRLVVETPNAMVRDQMEDLFEIYGLIIQGKMVPEALSGEKRQVRRLENQLDHAAVLLEHENALLRDDHPKGKNSEGNIQWLRTHMGRLLQHPETRPRPMKEVPRAAVHHISLFREAVTAIMREHPDIRSQISLVLQKLSMEAPGEQDINDISDALSSLKEKHPERFDEISDAFYDSRMAEVKSVWSDVFLEILNRLA
ncbi:MAG: pentapeptide repeat-containing protein [Desulfococcaceae bacterium]